MVLRHKLGHKPHASPLYWHISINRSGRSSSLKASIRLWWMHLVNRTIMERQFHQQNTLRLFGFSWSSEPKVNVLSVMQREETAKAPAGKLNSPFPIECDLKNPWGSVAICLRPACPQGQSHFYLLLIYKKHSFSLIIPHLANRSGGFFFPLVVQGWKKRQSLVTVKMIFIVPHL